MQDLMPSSVETSHCRGGVSGAGTDPPVPPPQVPCVPLSPPKLPEPSLPNPCVATAPPNHLRVPQPPVCPSVPRVTSEPPICH